MLNGNAASVIDGTRGEVLSLDGNRDFVSIASTFSNPANATLSAWVNLAAGAPAGEIISIGNVFTLRADDTNGTQAFFWDGTGWQYTDSGIDLAGTGWRHVAYSYDDASNTQTLYIDGEVVATTSHTASINYDVSTGVTTIGAHANVSFGGYDFNGLIDDARIYTRALSADEIAALANDQTTATGNVAIQVNPVNDAPTNVGSLPATLNVTEDLLSNLDLTSINLSDIDHAGGNLTLALSTDTGGNLTAAAMAGITIGTNGTDYVTLTGTLADLNSYLDVTTNIQYLHPTANISGTAADILYVAIDDNGNTGSGGAQSTYLGDVQIDIASVNDAPLGNNNDGHLNFDGIDDRVAIANFASLTMSTSMTLEAWFKADTLSNLTNMILNKEGEFEFAVHSNGSLQWAIARADNSWAWVNTGYIVTVDTWTHVAISYDNGTITTYVNGDRVHQATQSGPIGDAYPALNELWIGGRSNAANAHFDGSIDDVRIWSVARTQNEIRASLSNALVGNETGLVGYYQFNEQGGNTVIDASAHANHGTLGGATAEPVRVQYATGENTVLNVNAINGVLSNDVDVDNDVLTVTHLNGNATAIGVATTIASGASVTLNADGSFTYDPGSAFDSLPSGGTASDSFDYTISDGNGGTETATVQIVISGTNDAPVAVNDPSSFASAVLSHDPVGYWRLGESSGTTATNLGTLGTDGTYSGPTLGAVGAIAGDTAASFDGINDNVNLGTFDVNGTGLTMTAWFNADDFDVQDQRIISKALSTGANAEQDHWWMLSTQQSGSDYVLRFRLKAGGTTDTLVASSGTLSANQWYFAAATYDEATGLMQLFLNGNLVGSMTHAVGGAVSTDPTQTVMIGANPNGYGHFDGRIDEVAVFDQALDQSQLQSMYNSSAGAYSVDEDGSLNVSAAQGVLANDSDAENDSITAVLATGPANAASFTLNSDGSFTYTPNANFEGTDTFTYRANDGTDDSALATATINVTAVNDAPELDTLGTMTLTTITENDIANTGQTIASIIDSAGGDRITDVDSGALEGIAITSLNSGNGTWQFTTNGFLWADVGAVSESSALLLRSTDRIKFIPNGDSGTAASFDFRAWDRTNGLVGSKVDVTTNGGTTAFSSTSETASIVVSDINDEQVLATNTGATFDENSTSNTISTAMLETTDIDNTASQLIYTITTYSTSGSLYRNGVLLSNGGTFTQADIDSNLVAYSHNGAEVFSDSFSFSVDDGVGTASTGTFHIALNPVNDQAVAITSNGGGASASVTLNETIAVVTQVTVSDGDLPGDTFIYSIIGGLDQSEFTIDSSGNLSFVATPDYENPTDSDSNNVYMVTVQVSDGIHFDNQTITVTIADIQDAALTVTTTSDVDDSGLGGSYTIEELYAANGGTDGRVSLREAIIAANNTLGADTISFAILDTDAGYTGVAGVDAYWQISLTAALPTITESVVLDGLTQTAFSGNVNPGTLGADSSVGNGAQNIYSVDRPEIAIVGASGFAGIVVSADDVTIQGFSMYGFSSSAAILLNDGVQNTSIQSNVLGAGPTSISDPGAALNNFQNVQSLGADNGWLTNNILAYSQATGFYASNASDYWYVLSNHFINSGYNYSNGDAIAMNASVGGLIDGNIITGSSTQAIILSGSTSGVVISNNTITGNAVGPITGSHSQYDAIALRSGTNNVTISQNIIADNYGAGITVNNGAYVVEITQNSLYGNGTVLSRQGLAASGSVGLDLQTTGENANFGTAPYYTPNDLGDADTGGNSLQNFPVISAASSDGTRVDVVGNFNSLPNRSYRIEFFLSEAYANGHGQGETYLGSITVTTDGSGDAIFSTSLTATIPTGKQITATATDLTTLQTSEFSQQFAINDAPVQTSIESVALVYIENQTATSITATLTLADEDDTHIDSAVVTISGNYISGQDVLAFANTANITGLWDSGSGTLTLTGADSVANYQAALRSVTYANTSDAPNTTTRTVSFTINDGEENSNELSRDISVAAVNDAPVLDYNYGTFLNAITEDQAGNAGQTVASVLASSGHDIVTDVDSGAIEGIAIISSSSVHGTWQYSLDGGSNWLDVGTVSNGSALLLRATDLVRFNPDGQQGGSSNFGFRAWDQTSGDSAGDRVNITATGGTSAFSSNTESALISVSHVNDAPTISNASVVSLTGTDENTTSAPNNVSTILTAASWGDVDVSPQSGIAITGLTGNGTWEYSTGGAWTTISGVTSSNALLLSSTAQVRYVPDGDNGETAQFTFRAWDQTTGTASTSGAPIFANPGVGGGTTAYSTTESTAEIVVADVNDLISATADTATAVEAGGVANATAGANPTGNVLTNDTDVDTGDTMTVTGVASGSVSLPSGLVASSVAGTYGSITINSDGSYSYTVDNNIAAVQALRTSGNTLTDTFTYTVTDGASGSVSTQIVVTIQGQNDNPIAVADTVTATEAGGDANGTIGFNPTGNVLTNDTDVDAGDTKTVIGVAAGSLPNASGFVGAGVAGSYGSITLNANGSYSYTVDNSNPAVQALRGTSNTLTETFTYTMTDAAGAISTTQLTITIEGQNDDLIAADDIAAAVEAGGTANGTAGTDPTGNVLTNDTDVDAGDTKTVTGVAAGSQASTSGSVGSGVSGSYGSITINSDGAYTYTVDNSNAAVQALRTSGQSLTEVFSYTAQDTVGATSTAEITITITGSNDAPVAVANTATAIEASGVANNISGTNPSGNVLTNDTDVDAGDTKTVVGVDTGTQASTSGNVGATVVGTYGSIVLNSDGTYTYTLDNGNAAVEALNDGDSLTETFSYTVRDTAGLESTTQLTVTIQGRTDLPFAIVDMDTAVEDGGVANATTGSNPSGNVLDNDVGGNGKTVVGVDPGDTGAEATGDVGSTVTGSYGAVVINSDGSYTYTLDNTNPAVEALLTSGDHVTDVFTYTMEDSFGNKSTTKLTITVDGSNDNPVGNDDNGAATEAGGLANATAGSSATGNVLSNDTDVDAGDNQVVVGVALGSQLSASGSVGASVTGTYGSIVINYDGSYTYVINENNATVQALRATTDTISEVFTYTMEDTAGASSTAEITITIHGANDTPTAVVDTASAYEAGGVANGTAGTDPTGNVLTNDTDIDAGDTKTVIGVAAGSLANASGFVGAGVAGNYGSLTINSDGSYTYNVDNSSAAVQALRTSGQTLTDTFTYTMTDTDGLTSTSQITVTVHGANDAINAVADSATAVEAGGTANGTAGVNPTGNVLANDTDVDAGDTMTVSGVAAGSVASTSGSVGISVTGTYGAISIAANGAYTYTVDNSNAAVQALLSSSDTLTDTFTYTVTDAAGLESTTQITVTIQGADDAPEAIADTGSATEAGGNANGTVGSNATGNVLANDLAIDSGDAWSVDGVGAGLLGTQTSGVGQPIVGNFGTITINSDGSYTYEIDEDNLTVQGLRTSMDTLTDTFTYTVIDSEDNLSTTQIVITLQGANDNPVAIADTAIAVEAGGLANGTAGTNPTGNVLTNDTDVDAGDSKTVAGVAAGVQTSTVGNIASAVAGSYGSITINSDGSYSYSIDNSHAAVQALLSASDTLTDAFSYTVVDAAGATSTTQIVITIQGSNDAPEITAEVGDALSASISETNTTLTNSGTLTVTDVDLGDPVTSTVSGLVVTGNTTGLQSNHATLLAMLSSTATVLDGTEVADQLTWDFNSGGESFDYLAVGESLMLTYTLTVTDSQGVTDTQDVAIVINGTNDNPVVTVEVGDSSADALTETDTTLTTNGTLTVSDLDLSNTVTSAVSGVVATGTTAGLQSDNAALLAMLISTANVIDGSELTDTLTWNFNSGSEAFDYLALGESLTLTYTITVTDSQGATDSQVVVITVNGTNDLPIVGAQVGDSTGSTLAENGSTLSSSGTLTVSDLDLSDSVTSTVSSVNATGTTTGLGSNNAALLAMFTSTANVVDVTELTNTLTWDFNSGSETFAYLSAGESLTLAYTITVADSQGTTNTQDVTITITGGSTAPVITVEIGDSAAESLTETDTTLTSTGTLTVTDLDLTDTVASTVSSVVASGTTTGLGSNHAALLAMLSSTANVLDNTQTSGALTWNFNSGSEAFDYLASGESLTLTYTIEVEDSQGATDTQVVVITISGTADAPVITGGPATSSLTETNAGLTDSGTLTVTDLDVTDNVTAAVDAVVVSGTGVSSVPAGLTNAMLQNFMSVTPTAILNGSQTNNTLTWDFNSGSETFNFLATGETLVLTYTVSVTDDDGSPLSDAETVVLTITGTNDSPAITVEVGDSAAEMLTETNTSLTSSGTLTVSDADRTDLVSSNITAVVASGTTAGLSSNNAALLAMLSSTANVLDNTQTSGSLTWNFNSGGEAFDYLASGESLTLTYTIEVEDSQGATDTQVVFITINGTADAPVITGGPATSSLTETDAGLTDSGTFMVTDLDVTDNVTAAVDAVVVSGTGVSSVPAGLTNAMLQNFMSVTPTAILNGSQTNNTLNWNFNSGSEAFNFLATGETLVLTYTVSVTDDDGSPLSDAETVVLTITGTNDSPEITGGPGTSSLTETSTGLTDSGTLSVTDLDLTDNVTAAVDAVVVSGTGASSIPAGLTNAMLQNFMSVTPTAILSGSQTTNTLNWNFNSGSEAFNFLATGETLILTYTVRVTDDDGSPLSDSESVTVTITGTNGSPAITVEAGDSAAETLTETNTTLTSSGTLTVSDADLIDVVSSNVTAVVASGTTAGLGSNHAALLAMLSSTANVLDNTQTSGTLTWNFNSGSEAFDYLASGESLTLTYTIEVEDSQGATDTQVVVITISGTADAPVITGGPASSSLTETNAGLTDSGAFTVTDLDLTDNVTAAVDAVVVSGTGAVSVPAGLTNAMLQNFLSLTPTAILNGTQTTNALNWSFNSGGESFNFLATGETLVLTYTVSVTDDDGTPLSDSENVTITITGTNDAPISIADTAIAGEAGGISNGMAGTNPTGNVLFNDTDVDAGDTKTVMGVAAGSHANASGAVGTNVTGLFGSITIAADGTYSYTVDNSNSAVQALRTSSDSLEDVFTYTMQDSDGLTSTTQVTITIQGANDAPHDILSGPLAVDENALIGSSVGTVTGQDVDAGENFTYTMLDSAGGRFVIDNAGQITVANGTLLDRESVASHWIRIQVTDASGASHEKDFLVDINDVNEFDVTVPIDDDPSANIVVEDATIGTAVGITALASDADATTNNVTYTLDDDAGGLFAIDSVTGVVTVAGVLDYEVWTSHAIIVRATSVDGSQATETFTIDITDANENAVGPISDTEPANDYVLENSPLGTYVGITAFASDPDGTDTVTYSLDNDAAGRFSIDLNSGMVSTLQSLSFEENAQYNITVRATSSDGSFQTADFLILVGDVNESPVATNDFFATSYIDKLVITAGELKANDTDPDGDALQVILVTSPASGTLTTNANGSFTYTPVAGYVGTVSFAYAISDGQLQSQSALVTISIGIPTNVPAPETGNNTNNSGESSGPNNQTSGTSGDAAADSQVESGSGNGAASTSQPTATVAVALPVDERENTKTGGQAASALAALDEVIKEIDAEFSSETNSSSSGMEDAQYSTNSIFRGSTIVRQQLLEDELMKQKLDEINHIQMILADARSSDEERAESVFFGNLNPIVTTAVGTGVVIWIIHASQVAAAVLSTASAWVQLDPLTVLQGASIDDEPTTAEELIFDAPQVERKGEGHQP